MILKQQPSEEIIDRIIIGVLKMQLQLNPKVAVARNNVNYINTIDTENLLTVTTQVFNQIQMILFEDTGTDYEEFKQNCENIENL